MVFLTGCEDEEKTSKKEDTKTEQVEEKKITYKNPLICIYDDWNNAIYVDKDTKVMYWWHESSYKGGLTAMYNDDRTSYECVPCYNSVDEYIASEKEDLESYKADLEEALEELKDMREDWKPEKEPNMDEEIDLIKKWVKEREDFINE